MEIAMVWAQAHGRAIGRDGTMPWHLPEDLAHFKASTLGDAVVMGRRTWESLPERFRPLPDRRNIVVSRDHRLRLDGADVVHSLDAAFATILAGDPSARRACVIGGAQLFRDAMPVADELVVTRIDLDVPDADTFAPEIGPEWQLTRSSEPAISRTGPSYHFEWYHRGA